MVWSPLLVVGGGTGLVFLMLVGFLLFLLLLLSFAVRGVASLTMFLKLFLDSVVIGVKFVLVVSGLSTSSDRGTVLGEFLGFPFLSFSNFF